MKFFPGKDDGDNGRLFYYKLTAIAEGWDLRIDPYQSDIGKYCVIVESEPKNFIVPCKSITEMESYVRYCRKNEQNVLSYGLISMSGGHDKLIRKAFESWSKKNSQLHV